MRQRIQVWCFTIGALAACASLTAQNVTPPPQSQVVYKEEVTTVSVPTVQLPSAPDAAAVGGRLHGAVKSGKVPLPGVTVTAQNTLTGKKYATTTDITGAWSMTIPQNGRYVVRTQFAAFAQAAKEALFNAASNENHGSRDQAIDFDLTLASRAAAQEQQQESAQTRVQQAIQQLAATGAQSLSLTSALGGDTEAASGATVSSGGSGAALPSIAGNSDFGGESVSINGQSGQVSALAGMDPNRLRDALETIRAQGGGLFDNGNGFGGAFGGLFATGGPGGGGKGGFGGGPGGGRGNFRGFNPGQPHGAIFWFGSNSALNAEPWSVTGVPEEQPANGSNQFGLTFMSAPYIPGLWKPSGKDTIFFTLSGTRASSPSEYDETVPTDAQRAGQVSDSLSVTPVAQAIALLKFIPEPNIPMTAQGYNYHLLTTGQTNSTQAGVRYLRSFGANARQPGSRPSGSAGGAGSRRSQQNQGLRQSINANFNWSESASDAVNPVPELGGKSRSDSYSVQAGYTLGYKKLTNIFNANWNRADSRGTNYFGSVEDIATQSGILGPDGGPLNPSPLNWGLPNVSMSSYYGISQTQPSQSISQTISLSETLSWIHNKHNFRFGGDYRRVHRDFLGAGNATGSFTFTGLYTTSALGDFLTGQPQATSISAAEGKTYLRDNVYDIYANDDWRVRNSLTVNYGIRYEFFAPYTEKYNHLSMVDTNPNGGFTSVGQVTAGEKSPNYGNLPDSLVYPYRMGFSPRLGLAWRVPKLKQMVIRAGYGLNYTVGEYGTFATNMAYQPPFVNEQSNACQVSDSGQPEPCSYSLADGFPTPNTVGTYAVNPRYRLPHVQAYNLDIQKTLPWNIVMNLGYNGSIGGNMDIRIAPRAAPSSPGTDPNDVPFFYLQDGAFYHQNAGTVRVNKRLSNGFSVGANYQWMHAIDNAGGVGGASPITAQNWLDTRAEVSNSTIDLRHTVSGNYLYELPFGKDKQWATAGTASHILEGFSVSGTFTFSTGSPLNLTYAAATSDVASGTAGTLRPDYNPGVSIAPPAGSHKVWFNPNAFAAPTPANPAFQYAVFGNVPRNALMGPGVVKNNMSLSKTMQFGDTRSMEVRATANNVFNTVQYSGVGSSLVSSADQDQQTSRFGQVTSAGQMRTFQFTARYRF
jgi:trimeric autotransporter adhesin